MSSGSAKKNFQDLKEKNSKVKNSQNFIDKKIQKINFNNISRLISDLFKYKNTQYFSGLSDAIVSFLSLSNKYYPEDIYSGSNDIPFDELDPEFISILKQEFADVIK